jgi:hypothetical protein
VVSGSRGAGKTTLVRTFLGELSSSRLRLHWEIPPLDEASLLGDLDQLVSATLGELSPPPRVDLLPMTGSGARWIQRLEGILHALGPSGGVLVLDGIEHLEGARKRLLDEWAEVWRRSREQGRPVMLILVTRRRDPGSALEGRGEETGSRAEPLARIRVGARPFRVGARAGAPAGDAILRWSVFGTHFSRLSRPSSTPTPSPTFSEPRGAPTLRDEPISRVLDPRGDLHDEPLRTLERAVQAPQRYVAVVHALARGASDWSGVLEALGARGRGNPIAPYLVRLAEEGVVEIERPLGAPPSGRRRRYVLQDPFVGFWFSKIFPIRSLIHRVGPEVAYDTWVAPHLDAHAAAWLPVLARRWVEEHSGDAFGAPAREVGALWGDDEPMDLAARLANGWILYGRCAPGGPDAQRAAAESLDRALRRVRFGIGRETRIPLLFVLEPPDAELRRWTARTPHARVVTPDDLMGVPPGR